MVWYAFLNLIFTFFSLNFIAGSEPGGRRSYGLPAKSGRHAYGLPATNASNSNIRNQQAN